MSRIAFDVEGNGFLDTITKFHCICTVDIDTGERRTYGPDRIDDGIAYLYDAEVIIAHNGLRFDFPAIEKLYGFRHPGEVDSLVCVRTIFPNLKETDAELLKQGVITGKQYGSHSIEVWGARLGIPKKGTDIEDWSEWTQEMQDRCESDVEVLYALIKHMNLWQFSEQSRGLEHRIALVCNHMEEEGWPFDVKAAASLHAELVQEKDRLETELVKTFGSWDEPIPSDKKKPFVPKKDDKKRGYTKGVPTVRTHRVTFNPRSRQHIAKVLMDRGWKPEEFTATGLPKVDETVILGLINKFPAAKLLGDYLLIEKRLGQLADGDQGWLKVVGPDGRIHAQYNPNGAVTGRASHFRPNIAQVPSVRKGKTKETLFGKSGGWGYECRALFHVPPGWEQVGADMSGLELRCFAHYLWPYDDGAYAKVVLEGDVHTHNQKAAGLPLRDQAKTFIYAWLYGAGPAKIGKIVGGTAADGKRLIDKFLKAVPAVSQLRAKVKRAVENNGQLKGLDGRPLPIRSDHSALNTLLQSAGAILCKQWVCDSFDALVAEGFRPGWKGDFVFLGWIHDEIQIACREGLGERIGQIVQRCAREAGVPYGFRVRLDSEYKIGRSWADTH